MVITIENKTPKIGEIYLAETAVVVGDVEIGSGSSIWFNAVLRGDVAPIQIGNNTNIQDCSVLHGTYKKCGVKVGNYVSVGHSVILHGCDIGDFTLVGMGSVIMDLAKIGRNSLVAAGSLVTEESTFEDGVLIMGRPARVVRKLTMEEITKVRQNAEHYLMYQTWYEKK